MAEESRLYTVNEVAALLKISAWRVREKLRKGLIHGDKPAKGQWRIRADEYARLQGNGPCQ